MTEIHVSYLTISAPTRARSLGMRAYFEGIHDGARGRLELRVPLGRRRNGAATLFEPDHTCRGPLFGTWASGVVTLRCRCVLRVDWAGTTPGSSGVEVEISSGRGTSRHGPRQCVEHHDPGHAWLQPHYTIRWLLTWDELATIQAAVQARRDGLEPMAFAGISATTGLLETERAMAFDPEAFACLATLAGLRGHRLMPQSDARRFRIR